MVSEKKRLEVKSQEQTAAEEAARKVEQDKKDQERAGQPGSPYEGPVAPGTEPPSDIGPEIQQMLDGLKAVPADLNWRFDNSYRKVGEGGKHPGWCRIRRTLTLRGVRGAGTAFENFQQPAPIQSR